ncbi:MAG: hypothetical protein H8K05_20270, partial [Nitrospira sp.]|nr:hypothetical protein [Nitrospira sp.]
YRHRTVYDGHLWLILLNVLGGLTNEIFDFEGVTDMHDINRIRRIGWWRDVYTNGLVMFRDYLK